MTVAVRTIALAAALLVAIGDPAAAGYAINTFGATGSFRPGGDAAAVTVVLGCERAGVFDAEITVTQGATVAVGRRQGRCTGDPESDPVTVTTRYGTTLTAGTAEICGDATTREQGTIDDTRAWCRPDGVTLTLSEASTGQTP